MAFIETRLELLPLLSSGDVGIDVVELGARYPDTLVIEINHMETRIGFGYEHDTEVVEMVDRLIAALQQIREHELRALGAPQVVAEGPLDDGATEGPTGIAGTGHQ